MHCHAIVLDTPTLTCQTCGALLWLVENHNPPRKGLSVQQPGFNRRLKLPASAKENKAGKNERPKRSRSHANGAGTPRKVDSTEILGWFSMS